MLLFVGLGNPTPDSENNRHNVGFKISSVKLDSEVTPTIQGRDFVIATLAAPTVMKEPEKPAEAETTEGEPGAEGSEAAAGEAEKTPAEGEKKDADDKKAADKKTSEEKK